jgi:L-fuculose-phosphate aldolase
MSREAADRCRRRAALEVVAAGAHLASAGLILPGEGNLSMRTGSAGCLITPTGVDKGRVSAVDLVELPLDGGEVPSQASCEFRLHTSLYQRFPEVGAVVHGHPPAVQALTARRRQPDLGVLVEGVEFLGFVAWVGRLPPGSLDLAEAVTGGMAQGPACLLEGHGAVTVGSTMAEALRRMLLLERVAQLTLAVESP